ncbi:hypothetical protein GOL32_12275 [Sinorhizobium medicae]|nr:hypothetical protein [Sinorhizobium medicae]
MTRNCSVCDHPQREAINSMLVAGRSARDIAAAHGLNYQAIRRHRLNHLPQTIHAAALAALDSAPAAQTAIEAQTPATPAHGHPETVHFAPAIAPETSPTPVRRRTRGIQLTDSPPAPPVPVITPSAPAPAGIFNSYSEAVGLRDRAMNILELAERNGDAKTALTAIREARGVLEHLSRLEERNQSSGPAVPLAESPEWHRTRAAIISALADHPEARLAVATALVATGALN